MHFPYTFYDICHACFIRRKRRGAGTALGQEGFLGVIEGILGVTEGWEDGWGRVMGNYMHVQKKVPVWPSV